MQRLALVHKFKLEPDPRPRDESFAGGPDAPDGVVAVEQDVLDDELQIFNAAKAFVKEPRKPLPAWALFWKSKVDAAREAAAATAAEVAAAEVAGKATGAEVAAAATGAEVAAQPPAQRRQRGGVPVSRLRGRRRIGRGGAS